MLKSFLNCAPRKFFVEAGPKEDEYEPILEMVVSDDTDATVARAKAMIDLIESQKEGCGESC